MNDNEIDRALDAIHQARADLPDPAPLHERAFAVPLDSPHSRGWLSGLSPRWVESLLSTTRLVVAGAIVALFCALLLAGVLTQPREDQSVPAATADATPADDADSAPVFGFVDFSGPLPSMVQKANTEYRSGTDTLIATDTLEGRLTDMTDVRLNGRARIVINRIVSLGAGQVASYVVRIDNDGGSWLGRGYGYFDASIPGHPSDRTKDDQAAQWLDATVLQGIGAYAGLSAIMVNAPTDDGIRLSGAIFTGEIPEPPDMPAATESR